MSHNILTLKNVGRPANCADGVRTASEHLDSGPIIGMGEKSNSVSPELTEVVVDLAKRAKPEDCARCIAQYCMLIVDQHKVRGDRLQATYSKIIEHDPRETEHDPQKQKEIAYIKLRRQSDEFSLQDLNEIITEEDLVETSAELAKQGVDERDLAAMGLPVVDPEVLEDYKSFRDTLGIAA